MLWIKNYIYLTLEKISLIGNVLKVPHSTKKKKLSKELFAMLS